MSIASLYMGLSIYLDKFLIKLNLDIHSSHSLMLQADINIE